MALTSKPVLRDSGESTDLGLPWRMSLGAQATTGGVRFRVWAPKRARIDVVVEDRGVSFPLEKDEEGCFTGFMPNVGPGMAYRYRLDNDQAVPDPCSRYQPEGPHGPSLIVDPDSYRWRTADWPGVRMPGQVVYELHVGTFTQHGTFDSAIERLDDLKELGVTLLEVMPVAEFPGRWNWGYDGVSLFAPSRAYGDPDAFKRFVDAAHERGLGVILDVVYNHFGPDGNYLPFFSDEYLTDRHPNEWGQGVNFDGPGCRGVREFFIENACYWVSEFRLDGLRLDAVQAIRDDSRVHILSEISQRARSAAAGRSIVLIAECESQLIRTVRPPERRGWGLDAVWSDDFHHACRVAATGRSEAYYTDYRGSAQEFISLVKRGFLYQGQRYEWQNKPRGTVVTDEPACAFVFYLQNHDQVANHLQAERIRTMAGPARYRALAAVLLLAPETPMLFMGQEFGATTPFLFFADHAGALGPLVYEGRKTFLSEFPSYASPEAQAALPDPGDRATFLRCKLDDGERGRRGDVLRLHRDLLRLRREDPVLARQDRVSLDGAVLGPQAFCLRHFAVQDGDRLLVINLGTDLTFVPAPEPLLAPVAGGSWRLLWSSDHPRYGGPGIVNPLGEQGWRIPACSAALYAAERAGC